MVDTLTSEEVQRVFGRPKREFTVWAVSHIEPSLDGKFWLFSPETAIEAYVFYRGLRELKETARVQLYNFDELVLEYTR